MTTKPVCQFCYRPKEGRHTCARPTEPKPEATALTNKEVRDLRYMIEASGSPYGARAMQEVDRLRAENAKQVETIAKLREAVRGLRQSSFTLLQAIAGTEFSGSDDELDRLDAAEDALREAPEGSQ